MARDAGVGGTFGGCCAAYAGRSVVVAGATALTCRIGLASSRFDSGVPGAGAVGPVGCGGTPFPNGATIGWPGSPVG